MAEIEEWKDILGYEGIYKISNLGRVFSNYRETFKTPTPHKLRGGYLVINLTKDKKLKTHYLHILVATAFVEKPKTDIKLEVNHKDMDVTNSKASNLEWMTRSQNIQHSYDNNKKRDMSKVKDLWKSHKGKAWEASKIANSIKVNIEYMDGTFSYFNSMTDACVSLGVKNSTFNAWASDINKGYLKHNIKNIEKIHNKKYTDSIIEED